MNTGFIKAIVILPGTALVYVPGLIVWLTSSTSYAASFPPKSVVVWVTGLIFLVAGLVLMLWTMRLFASKGGGGTPAPWEPIQNFVVEGPYQHVRNPMLTGVILFQIAEAILLWSIPLLIWAIFFFILNTFYFASPKSLSSRSALAMPTSSTKAMCRDGFRVLSPTWVEAEGLVIGMAGKLSTKSAPTECSTRKTDRPSQPVLERRWLLAASGTAALFLGTQHLEICQCQNNQR